MYDPESKRDIETLIIQICDLFKNLIHNMQPLTSHTPLKMNVENQLTLWLPEL